MGDHLRFGNICGSGSFAVQFGDHFRSGDHLRRCDPLGPQMKRAVNACKPAEASHAWRYKSNSTSKYGKSDHHLIIQCLSFWVSNNSANNYVHYQVERQDFITILQSFLGKHWHLPRSSTWKIRGFAKSRPAAHHGPAARRPSGPEDQSWFSTVFCQLLYCAISFCLSQPHKTNRNKDSKF